MAEGKQKYAWFAFVEIVADSIRDISIEIVLSVVLYTNKIIVFVPSKAIE